MSRKEKKCVVQVCRRKKGERSTSSFFSLPEIPKDDDETLLLIAKKRREVWLKKINHNDSPNLTGIYICNQHFYTGQPSEILDYDHPDWAPSINLSDVPLTPAKKEALEEKLLKHKKRIMQEKKSEKGDEKREMDTQFNQNKKAKINMPVKRKQLQTSNNVDFDQESSENSSSADDSLCTDEEDNSSSTISSLSESEKDGSNEDEVENDSVDNETSPQNKQDSDVNMLSLEELREELISVRNKNNDLSVQIAAKTEEIKQLQLDSPSLSDPDPPINNEPSANQEPRWKILHNVGRSNKPFLLDGLGHRFVRFGELARKNGTLVWGCGEHQQHQVCDATVHQTGDTFVVAKKHKPFCQPKPNWEYNLLLASKIKQMAKENPHEPKENIVKSLLQDPMFNNRDPSVPELNPASIFQTIDVNRMRLVPQNPEDLFFNVQPNKIPKGFLREDVVVAHSEKLRERHLIFGTEEQTDLLKSAKCWFLDRTSRFIKEPFVELVSIHAAYSVSSKTDLKHVPLLFIFMSSRKVNDYLLVFEKILEMLDNEHRVKEIVFNYRTAVLQALEKVFPSVSLYGCPFQWSKTLLRNLKSFGLISLYEFSEDVQKSCSRLLSLHLLPGAEIPKAFRRLKDKASKFNLSEEQRKLFMKFFKYVEKMWINNSVWTPDRWSVFMQPVTRTDADAWHKGVIVRRVIKHISVLDTEKIDFYRLVSLLRRQLRCELSRDTDNVRLLSQRKQTRIVRKQTNGSLPSQLYQYWDAYNQGGISRRRLLKVCASEFIEHSDLKFVYDTSEKHLDLSSDDEEATAE